MKTIIKNNEILRVDNKEAEARVLGGWKFIPKKEWKEKVRDINKQNREEAREERKQKKENKQNITKKVDK